MTKPAANAHANNLHEAAPENLGGARLTHGQAQRALAASPAPLASAAAPMRPAHRATRVGAAAGIALLLSVTGAPAAVAAPTLEPHSSASAAAKAEDEKSAAANAQTASENPAARETAAYKKTEIIYGSLDAKGALQGASVVNKLDVETAGTVVDFGAYDAVRPMVSTTPLEQSAEATEFSVEEGTFYYQGDTRKLELPWNFKVSYTLFGTTATGAEKHGETVDAADLGGANGTMSIHVTTSKNESVPPDYYDSYMMQATFTLNDTCKNVVAEGATVAAAGENQTAAFTVLPGRNADFTLTMQVEGFTMPAAQIAALPYASVIETPETEGMTDQMQQLSDAVAQLNEGTAQLANGVNSLNGGASSLSSGAVAFGDGLDAVNASSGAIVNASAQINGALSTMAAALADPATAAQLQQLGQLGQLKGAIDQLANALDGTEGQTVAVALAGAQIAYGSVFGTLGTCINGLIPEGLTGEDVEVLKTALADPKVQQALGANAQTVGELAQLYGNAAKLQGVYNSPNIQGAIVGGNQALEGAAAGIQQQAAALRQIASALPADTSQLTQLTGGISELAGQYAQFHDGLQQYAGGVGQLASNYTQLESGVAQLASGVSSLAQGAGSLSGGMASLNEATITLPAETQKQIDDMMADYTFPEFEPQSFMSKQNTHTQAVQFVITLPAIEAPEEPEAIEEPATEPSIWDRFMALFQ